MQMFISDFPGRVGVGGLNLSGEWTLCSSSGGSCNSSTGMTWKVFERQDVSINPQSHLLHENLMGSSEHPYRCKPLRRAIYNHPPVPCSGLRWGSHLTAACRSPVIGKNTNRTSILYLTRKVIRPLADSEPPEHGHHRGQYIFSLFHKGSHWLPLPQLFFETQCLPFDELTLSCTILCPES